MRWADRYGKWLMVSSRDIRRADDWFDKHGHKTVFFARLVPGVRSLISIPAGLSEMHLPTFSLYSALGTGLWAFLLAALGALLGENYDAVDTCRYRLWCWASFWSGMGGAAQADAGVARGSQASTNVRDVNRTLRRLCVIFVVVTHLALAPPYGL